MSYGPIDGNAGTDTNDTIYYKKLQQQLKARAELKNQLNNTEDRPERGIHSDAVSMEGAKNYKKEDEKTEFKHPDIKDEVKLSSYEWEKKVLEQRDGTGQNQERDRNASKDKDPKEILKVGYAINFMKRIPELKEMYRFNLIEARSHQDLVGKFSQFKVGVIGQMLALAGVSVEELKKLKKQAIQEAFEENLAEMIDNIYHEELSELIHGKTKKTKAALRVYSQYRANLATQMTNLGRPGYWTSTRILEERVRQCAKIEQEFKRERDNLLYQLDYLLQASF